VFVLLIGIFYVHAHPKSYHEEEAKRLLLLSAASYCGIESIHRWDCRACHEWGSNMHILKAWEKTVEYEGKECNFTMFVGLEKAIPPKIHVVFEGARNWEHLVERLNTSKLTAVPELGRHVAVNPFILQIYNTFRTELEPFVAHMYIVTPLLHFSFTGHSVGGSVAVLAAAMLRGKNLLPDVSKHHIFVYTFGEPRVGNHNFAKKLNYDYVDTVYRVVHDRDPIPHFPPCYKHSGICIQDNHQNYFHHLAEVFYNEDMSDRYHVCTGFPPGEDERCSMDKRKKVNIYSMSGVEHTIHQNKEYFGISVADYC